MPFFPNATISIYATTATGGTTYKKSSANNDSELYTNVSAHLRPVEGAFDSEGNQGFTCYIDTSDASALTPSSGDKYRINDGTYDYQVIGIIKNYVFNKWQVTAVRKRQ